MFISRKVTIFILFVIVISFATITLMKSRHVIAMGVFDRIHSPALATSISGSDSELEMRIGEYYFGAGGAYDVKRAQYHFERAVAIEPATLGGRYQLSRLAFLRGDYDEALRDIEIHIKDHPWYSRNYYMKGLIAGFKKDYPTSIASFRTYIKLDPDYWAGYNDLAWVQLASGDYDGALMTIDAVLPRMGEIPWLMNSRGLALMHKKRDEEAIGAFRSARKGFLAWGPSGWGKAYPGNDPAIYGEGYAATLAAVDANIALLSQRVTSLQMQK